MLSVHIQKTRPYDQYNPYSFLIN